MPPNPPIDEHALECLSLTRNGSITADLTTVQPFGEGTTVHWSATVPPRCGVRLALNGQTVAASGRQQVEPASTTRYTLTAHVRQASKVLGSVVVNVDTTRCVSGSVPETLIRSQVERAVDQLDAASKQISKRSDPRVEVKSDGIHLALRFTAAIDNFPDPKIDIDCVIGVRLRRGSVEPFYTSFGVDVDWPWWVTTITAGASKIVEEFIDDKVEGKLKPLMLSQLKDQVNAIVTQLPGDLQPHTISLAENEVRVTACPGAAQVPFMVIAGSR